MSLLFPSYGEYYIDTCSAFHQYQFLGFEDQLLQDGVLPVFVKPQLRLFFAVPVAVAKLEIARILFIFNKLFWLKPKMQSTVDGFYRLCADFDQRKLSKIVGLLLRLKRVTGSKFLRFSPAPTSVTLVLDEPLTFFPLVHRGFDYHDWVYPFIFDLSFSLNGASGRSQTTLARAVNFFKV